MDKLWKVAERKIAKIMGGKRIPVTGRSRGDKADIEHDFFSVEVKHRDSLPEWIEDAMVQAKASDPDGGKYPLVILHGKGYEYDRSLAILELRDILAIKYRLELAEKHIKTQDEIIQYLNTTK